MWRDAQSLKAKIDRVFVYASTAEDELKAELARYACILASGLIEVSCRASLSEYARSRSDQTVTQYVGRQLASFANPKVGKIYELLSSFDPVLEESVRAKVDDEIEGCVNSIVANRNNFAHGGGGGLSLGTMKKYYDGSLRMLKAIDQACGSRTR